MTVTNSLPQSNHTVPNVTSAHATRGSSLRCSWSGHTGCFGFIVAQNSDDCFEAEHGLRLGDGVTEIDERTRQLQHSPTLLAVEYRREFLKHLPTRRRRV